MATRDMLVSHGCDDQATSDATLLVSELVTNAVLHAETAEVELRLAFDGGLLHVEVADDDRRTPDPDRTGRLEGGRGLQLVASVAQRWGAAVRPGAGKVVWFDLPCFGPARASG